MNTNEEKGKHDATKVSGQYLVIPLFKYKLTGGDQVSQQEIRTFGFGMENLVTLSHPVGTLAKIRSEKSYGFLRQGNKYTCHHSECFLDDRR